LRSYISGGWIKVSANLVEHLNPWGISGGEGGPLSLRVAIMLMPVMVPSKNIFFR
jgi:hypothetical protein